MSPPPPSPGLSLWLAPHRPLFLAAGLWALLAMLAWQWGAHLGPAWAAALPPRLGTPGLWHAHEMVFGFGGASVAAYFLTAVTSWTDRPPLQGRALAALLAVWLAARAVMLQAHALPPALVLAPGAIYFAAVAGRLLRDIAQARAWAKLGFPALVLAMGAVDAALVWTALSGQTGLADRLALAGVLLFALKVAYVAGAMIPAFTANALRQRGADTDTAPPVDRPGLRRAGLALQIAALACVALADRPGLDGPLLLAAAAVQALRLCGWRSLAIRGQGLLVMMHLTFGLLVLGLAAVGLGRLWPASWPLRDALHLLSIGAMGGMVLSVASRAAARRVGGALQAGRALPTAHALVCAAAVLRAGASQAALPLADPYSLAAALWCGAWLLFLIVFVPTTVGPVLRPVFSGSKA
ncbi:MAG: NnrS family protein [Pseudomonadota bacterium]|jgi:uncharacterized protein involved in response to NO